MSKKQDNFYETYRKIRRDWGQIDPRIKIIPSKKQIYKRKPKYKESGEEE